MNQFASEHLPEYHLETDFFTSRSTTSIQTKKELIMNTLTKYPSGVRSVSSIANEAEEMRTSDLDTSLAKNIGVIDSLTYLSAHQQVEKRKELSEKCNDFALLNRIEDFLAKLAEKTGPIQSKEQLESIKEKYRQKWLHRMEELKENIVVKTDKEFKENCSFKPSINSNKKVKSRYLEVQTKPVGEYLNQECTFTPNVNRSSSLRRATSKERSGYSSCSKDENKGIEDMKHKIEACKTKGEKPEVVRKNKNRVGGLEEDGEDSIEKYCLVQPVPPEKKPEMDSEESGSEEERISKSNREICKGKEFEQKNTIKMQRLNRAEQNRARTLLREKKSPMTTMSRNKTPLASVENIQQVSSNKSVEDFLKRSEQLKEKKMKNLKEIEKENYEKFSFKPKVSKAAQNVGERSYEEKCVQFLKNKEDKLARMREEKEKKELEGVTHQPNINREFKVTSKLNINLPTQNYISLLQEKEEIEKEFSDMMKKRREALETVECTHRPQIREMPSFVISQEKMVTSRSSLDQSGNYKELYQKKKQATSSNNSSVLWKSHSEENFSMSCLLMNEI